MSVDTKGIIKGKVNPKEIYNIICDLYDEEAIYNIDNENSRNEECGFICFKDGKDQRQIYVSTDTNEKWKEKYLLDSGIDKDYVYLSLGMWNNSVEIISNIVKNFGGYIDENDCDEIGYVYIPKDKNYNYSDYIKNRERIENILDDSLSDKDKISVANQILKHKEELKNLL